MCAAQSLKTFNKLSKIFQPVNVIPKDAKLKSQGMMSNSQKLMLELGLIKSASTGSYHFLPLAMRSLNKLTRIVDYEMNKIGGQKVLFPTLTNAKLWKTTGRYDQVEGELFKVKDRNYHTYVLSPTHEEVASELLASVAHLSYRNLPIRLYQITSKYRDEMKPKFGLMRSRQFIMKDLYTFDVDIEAAKNTYETVCEAYNNIFSRIGIDFVKVEATTGNMGGSLSHEYHYLADIGEDEVVTCTNCSYSANTELVGKEKCPKCDSSEGLQTSRGIEVAHTFLLGDKYSKPLNAVYLTKDAQQNVLQMGSYGIGLTRLIAASIEALSLEQEMRWPDALVPFSVVIIPPKAGSKEESQTKDLTEKLYNSIEALPDLKDDVLLDDRTGLTIGRRFLEARKMGYRFIVVIGKKSVEESALFEITDLKRNSQLYLNETALVNYIKQNHVKLV